MVLWAKIACRKSAGVRKFNTRQIWNQNKLDKVVRLQYYSNIELVLLQNQDARAAPSSTIVYRARYLLALLININ